MNKVKSLFAKGKKKALALIFASFMAVSMSVCASAADSSGSGSGSALSGASDLILEQFQGAANDITPIILGILGVGLGIFVIFIGIKLGKKMFTTVAK